jgi:hypothetical protein
MELNRTDANLIAMLLAGLGPDMGPVPAEAKHPRRTGPETTDN